MITMFTFKNWWR